MQLNTERAIVFLGKIGTVGAFSKTTLRVDLGQTILEDAVDSRDVIHRSGQRSRYIRPKINGEGDCHP